jgi:NAD(P)-dependent dehydrogenase (short-subunit alcohol dehydrogenase family)
MRLSQKVMMITGGGTGIGQATALRCAREGAQIVVMDVSPEGVRETERLLAAEGEGHLSLQGDVARDEDWKKAIRYVMDRYGRLNVLFNNAGTNLVKPLTETTEEDWARILDLNLKGTFLGVKHVLPIMVSAHGGAIVNHASALGLVGFPNTPVYAASKGGIIALTRQLAVDYARENIRVNCLCTGPTLTPRLRRYVETGLMSSESILKDVPMGRFAEPGEIAAAVLFLASEEASFITGTALVIDGGLTAH